LNFEPDSTIRRFRLIASCSSGEGDGGLTETENMRRYFDPERRAAISAEFHPMGRMATPQEVADACVWAASDRASAITGHVIPIDTGWNAR
jgi:NAD(P)-dependent dehydrogenase (short-subunit alcohol dehydrogenase family)